MVDVVDSDKEAAVLMWPQAKTITLKLFDIVIVQISVRSMGQASMIATAYSLTTYIREMK